MLALNRFAVVVLVGLLQACGGSSGTSNFTASADIPVSSISSQSLASTASSSQVSPSVIASSVAASLPAVLPEPAVSSSSQISQINSSVAAGGSSLSSESTSSLARSSSSNSVVLISSSATVLASSANSVSSVKNVSSIASSVQQVSSSTSVAPSSSSLSSSPSSAASTASSISSKAASSTESSSLSSLAVSSSSSVLSSSAVGSSLASSESFSSQFSSSQLSSSSEVSSFSAVSSSSNASSSVISSSSSLSSSESSSSVASSSSQASSVLASSASSFSSALSSSSVSSALSSSLPADFPVGTIDALPVLNIDTDGAAPIVSKDDYLKGTFSLAVDGAAPVTGTLEVRGRGNSTWTMPKKPYRLKLTNSTALMGMPANKHWVLLANYADKTLMRNDIAFMFSRSLGMEYTVRSQYVDLSVNGVYQGVYQLAEHIRIGKDRVNIPELKVTDTAADKISGGYLLEIDFRRGEALCIDSTHRMEPFCVSSPETLLDPAWSAQRAYIEKYLADTEAALFSDNFADPATGYAAYLDVDSTINYYLINELFKNVDGAVTSAFLYKKRGGKLFFGPIWDFDLALSNAGYDGVGLTDGWHIRKATWFARLFEDPAFEAKVKARWQQLKAEGKFEQIFQYAEARALWLDNAETKNFNLWPIFFEQSWYTRIILGSYDLEVQEMIRWQRERLVWMDAQLSQ